VPETYAALVPQGVQPTSPVLEKVLAGHTEQFALLVVVQGVDGKEPAAHTVQAAHGARPVAL
jgi:hypothetical protein